MDKLTFANDMETRLRQLASQLDQMLNRPASAAATAEASRQLAETRSRAQAVKSRISETLVAVNALRNTTDPDWEQSRQSLEQRWEELSRDFPL